MSQQLRQKYLSQIPNVDRILAKPEMVQLENRVPKGIILEAENTVHIGNVAEIFLTELLGHVLFPFEDIGL